MRLARVCHVKSFLCRSFVAATLQRYPNASIVDIICWWHNKQCCNSGLSTVTNETDTFPGTVSEYDVAEIQLLNKLYEEPMSSHSNMYLRHYSTAHFAAELGSIFLLEMLFSQGVVLHDYAFEDPQKPNDGTPHRQRVSLGSVARYFPNIEGFYLSHIAAKNGHLYFLQYLVDHLGTETVLGQRTAATNRRQNAGVPLSVYGTAFVYGRELILNWVDTLYPAYGFTLFEKDTLCCVQRASAHGQVGSLIYFVRLYGQASHVTLREALYPAAEAGAENVLEFLVDTLGADCVWWPDVIGATALHHAARLGSTALLLGFFQRYNVCQHVDDTDSYGRTPAMWCVMGGQGIKNIEFLRLLRQLGSRWPITVDNNGFSVGSLAQFYYLPQSKMRRFIANSIASACRQR